MNVPAPDEAIQAWGALPYQRQVKINEWHSACPVCGSAGHGDDGPPPDRFFIIAELGDPERTRGTCRRCGYTAFAINEMRKENRDLSNARRMDSDEISQNAAARRAESERAAALTVAARQRFNESKLWEVYHAGMAEADRAWWAKQGVPKEWQDYWLLGAVEQLWDLGPAYTIPFFGLEPLEGGSRCPSTLQYRLQRSSPTGKYRFEPNLGASAFIARPDLGIAGQTVYVVEGGKKAMVTHILGTGSTLQVVGFPSKSNDGGIIAQLKLAARVYIILDPDAWIYPPSTAGAEWIPWPIRYSRSIGKHAKVSRLPQKIDDALLDGSLDQRGLESILTYARSYA